MRRLGTHVVLCLVIAGAPACSVPERPIGGETAVEETGGPAGKGTDREAKDGSGQLGRPALVTRVSDGDTVEVRFQGRIIDVRLIGIDTPETVHPTEPVGCYGPAASRFTKQHLDGRKVRLEFDVERLDRYGRTLAYVWVDGELFNEVLVAQGYAQVSTYPPNVKYVDRFLKAQREAVRNNRGLWESCPVRIDSPGGGAMDGGCDRESYPDVCIVPYPPDLDCADIPYNDFQVRGPDPHGFDGDGDGIGCET